MFSILWYSAFSFLGGFSTSFRMLFAIRALFGIGMGGVWAAGMPLTLEHWPAKLRGTASGLMQSGYSMGFLLSSLVFEFVYPHVNAVRGHGLAMDDVDRHPAVLLVFFIMRGVEESPVWLDRAAPPESKQPARLALARQRLFKPDLILTTVHTSLLMGAFLFMYHSITYRYPTLITQMHRPTLPYLGRAEHRRHHGRHRVRAHLGRGARPPRLRRRLRRWSGSWSIPMYVLHAEYGAAAGRRAGHGLLRRRQLRRRPRLPHRALSDGGPRRSAPASRITSAPDIGSFTPTLVGLLQDRGLPLPSAMAACIAASGTLVIVLMWLGPKRAAGTSTPTTGRQPVSQASARQMEPRRCADAR